MNAERLKNNEPDLELDRALKQALDEAGPEVLPDCWKRAEDMHHFSAEEICALAEAEASENAQEHRPRQRRIVQIAACLAAVLLISGLALPHLRTIEADADPTEVVDSLDGVVNESGMDSASKQGGLAEENCYTWIVTDASEIEQQKENYPELYVPGYIPEGYTFDDLMISSWEDGNFQAQYFYQKDGDQLQLLQINGVESAGWSSAYLGLDGEKKANGILYRAVDESEGINNLYFVKEGEFMLQVSGVLDWAELEKILDSFGA